MLGNFIEESTNAPGAAATVNLAGSPGGRVPWLSRFNSGALAFYVMSDSTQAEAGIGYATAGSPNTFNRQTVLWNSLVGTTSPGRLNFAGVTKIYNEVPAERVLYADQNNNVNIAGLIIGKGAVVIGTGCEYYGTVLPAGYLWCNGAAVSRSIYAALFTAIGTAHGAGNGSTTFNVPDVMGRGIIGREGMGGVAAPARITVANSALDPSVLGGAGGDERLPAHTHTGSSAPHNHGVTDNGHGHGVTDNGHNHKTGQSVARNFYPATTYGYVLATSGSGSMDPNNQDTSTTSTTGLTINNAATGLTVNNATAAVTINSAGGGSSGNIPPALIANKIIFAGV